MFSIRIAELALTIDCVEVMEAFDLVSDFAGGVLVTPVVEEALKHAVGTKLALFSQTSEDCSPISLWLGEP